MKILIGSEFGAGRGHISRAAGVEAALRERFTDVVAETHVGWSQALLAAELQDASYVKIPFFEAGYYQPTKVTRQKFGSTLFETLTVGPDTWLQRLAYWDDVFKRFKPDVVLAEYAPGLSMYARGRVPVVVTGTGYSIPPTDAGSFPILMKEAPPALKTEAECVEILNQGLKRVSSRLLDVLPQMNAGDFVGLVTLPIFDPYWQTRTEKYLGTEIKGGAPSPKPHTSKIAAYFSNVQVSDEVWHAIAKSGIETEIYILESAPKFSAPNMKFRTTPFNLKQELPGFGLVIHSGGLGFAAAALHAGVPQMILYKHDEHWVHANAVVRAQVGTGRPGRNVTAKDITDDIHRILNEQHFRKYALALSEHYKPFASAQPDKRIAGEIGLLV